MTTPYDIFETDADGSVVWCGATETLADAEARVKMLAEMRGCRFIILNQETGGRVVIQAGGSGVTPTGH
jgi:hypothetical protein